MNTHPKMDRSALRAVVPRDKFKIATTVKRLVVTLALLAFVSARAEDKPNIIFIFSDDHAQHAISAYGSKVNTTPHIDRLAKEGARFTRSFVLNSICTPSRATLLTGQYSHVNGVPVFNRFDGARDHVAKHLDYLDATGLAKNTIVIYSSDNGWFLGDLGLYDKRFMYEPGLNVPLLARGPGIKAGVTPAQFVSNLDLAPTFLDLAGLSVPDFMQGRSLAPLLRGETPKDWRTCRLPLPRLRKDLYADGQGVRRSHASDDEAAKTLNHF